ncbi:hypothetical protein [Allocoleopsis sp.]|uniref:hypothetical protein n=1 Tax=Allocoleopsis sp. TaxID=3088169 RepID=UPI002FD1D92C
MLKNLFWKFIDSSCNDVYAYHFGAISGCNTSYLGGKLPWVTDKANLLWDATPAKLNQLFLGLSGDVPNAPLRESVGLKALKAKKGS